MKRFIGLSILLLASTIAMSCKKKSDYLPQNVPYYHFISVTFPDLNQTATLTNDTAFLTVPYGTNVSNVKTVMQVVPSITTSVPLQGSYDYSNPFPVVLTGGGNSKTQYIKVNYSSTVPDIAVLGVWVAISGGSPTLLSQASIDAMVNRVDSAGFNAIFAGVYNQSRTLYPSSIMQANVPSGTQAQVVPGFDGLDYLIRKAHAKNIKVFAWFEYGFISAYTNAGPILTAHPDWGGVDYWGKTTVRGNFYWLNAFKPEVQQFMTDLVKDCVSRYDVDGIQLDDHCPAIPLNSGYDVTTAAAYKTATGNTAPQDSTNAAWVTWRQDQLTAYLGRFYTAVKSVKPKCIISLAPAPGFGKGSLAQNNLQDYAAWVRNNYYDLMSPLQYQSTLSAYQNVLNSDLSTIINNTTNNPTGRLNNRYFPGMDVTPASATVAGSTIVLQSIEYNRSKGIKGEVIWYYDGIGTNSPSWNAFRTLYPQGVGKTVFPNL
ncbi:glycoside hydrolase family 10 protein [Chitinophagaceae bacterium LWZ2-11]